MSKAAILDDLLAQALLSNRAQEREEWKQAHPDGKTSAYISDAGRCEKQVWYGINDWPVTNPPGVDSLMNFALGHAAEEAFSDQLSRFGLKLVREVRVEIPWGHVTISGRTDFLLVAEELNCIAELKSTSQRQMYAVSKSGGRDENKDQLLLYLLAGKLDLLQEYGITPEMCEEGVLAYLVKDATKGKRNRWFYDVPFDWHQAQEVMDSLALVTDLAKLPTPPARPDGFSRDKFPCGWCDYQEGCWDGRWSNV